MSGDRQHAAPRIPALGARAFAQGPARAPACAPRGKEVATELAGYRLVSGSGKKSPEPARGLQCGPGGRAIRSSGRGQVRETPPGRLGWKTRHSWEPSGRTALCSSCGAQQCFRAEAATPAEGDLVQKPPPPQCQGRGRPPPRCLPCPPCLILGPTSPAGTLGTPATMPETPDPPIPWRWELLLPKWGGLGRGLEPPNLHISYCNSIKRSDNLSLQTCVG